MLQNRFELLPRSVRFARDDDFGPETARRSVLWLAMACNLSACSDIPQQVILPPIDSRPVLADSSVPLGSVTPKVSPKSLDALLWQLRYEDKRAATIAYRISTANVELCSDKGPQTGLLLQSALQYGFAMRPVAERVFELDNRPTVEAIVPESPSDQAQLRVGDAIVAVNGIPLTVIWPMANPNEGHGTYAPVEAALGRIDLALQEGSVSLGIQRGSALRDIRMEGVPGCAYDAQVIPSGALNASADGRHVFITTALVDYAASDDALAFVLGHEFAHNLLHHPALLRNAGFAVRLLGVFGSTPRNLRLTEEEADYVGLYLAARAGYSVSHDAEFLQRLGVSRWEIDWSHPSAIQRAATIAVDAKEIAQKIRDAQPLIPNRLP